MRAVVVYESLWGNTAAVARAIAEGLGHETPALTTTEAVGEAVAGLDLIVAGAPVLGFALPTEKAREDIRKKPGKAPTPPDLSHPPLRTWLAGLPAGNAWCAAFETRLRWTLRGSSPTIMKELEQLGYRRLTEPRNFLVGGTYGPLRDGELDKARSWGEQLVALVTSAEPPA